jgi:hypothetical protein
LKQLVMSAGVALAVGAVFIIGCSSSSHSGGGFFVPSAADLNNGDNAPMSSISQNNLASDNAGFSGPDQNFVALQCKVNKKPSNSDGPATSADGSAVVAFQTADQNDGHFRLYMSYYDGTTFTPPIEVTGQDRDEYAGAGGFAPDITTNNILLIPLNTAGYTGTAGATTGDAGAARANSGNWVIVWDATTYTVQPNTLRPNNALQPTVGSSSVTIPLSLNQGQRIQQNLQGAHRALYETVFVKSLHTSPSTFSQILGTNGTTTTTGIPSREYRYGFLVTAVQVTTLKRGQEVGAQSTDFGPFPAVTTTVAGTLDPTVAANSTGDFTGLAANTGTNAGVYANVATRTGVAVATLEAQNAAFAPATALNAVAGALVAGSVLVVTPATTGYLSPGGPDKGTIKSPAESVQSYGFASDGIAGQANFAGSGAFAFSATKGSTNAVDNPISIAANNPVAGHPERVEMPHTFVGLNSNTGPSPNGIGQTTNNALLGPFGPVGSVIANPSPGGNPGGASYTIGEDVSFVQLFWTQILSSANSGDTVQAMTPTEDTNDVGVHVGNRLAAFNSGLDLRTMLFAAPTEVTVPVSSLTEPQPQPLKAAVSPICDFSTYNQFVFFNFMDASICHVDPGAVHDLMNEPQVTDNASVREFNLALLVYAANDAGNGTSALGAPTRLNVVPTSTMTADKMDILFTFGSGGTPPIDPLDNPGTFGNQAQAWLASSACIFGPDEGLGDTTVFFVERHDSALAVSTDSNIDLELGAAVLLSNAALQSPGKNPVILSSHIGENTDSHNVGGQIDLAVGHPNQVRLQTDFQVKAAPVSGTVFEDPVEGVQTCLNRAGTYVVVTYRQWMGTSSTTFSKALNAVVMKTFRVAASNGGGISPFISSNSPPQVDLRFAAGAGTPSGAQPTGGNATTAAIRLDVVGVTGQSIGGQPGTPAPVPTPNQTPISTGEINMLYVPNNPLVSPQDIPQPFFPTSTGVNAQRTAPCGYRCSFQSDTQLINVIWEQSDTSEDRVYIRQLKVDTTNNPPVVTLGSTDELEKGNPVLGDAILNAFQDPSGNFNVGTVVRNSFDFLEGDVDLTEFELVDLGNDSTGKGGGLLVLYSKTTDGTDSDGNVYDRSVLAAEWDGTSFTDRAEVSRNVFEDAIATLPADVINGTNILGTQTKTLAGGMNFQVSSGAPLALNNNGSGPTNVPFTVPFGGGAVTPGRPKGKGLQKQLVKGISVPANPAIESAPSQSPTSTIIICTCPTGDNANSSRGLHTRKFDHTLRATKGNTATFGDQFVPTAGSGVRSRGTTAPDALEPTRLDHMTGGDVTSLIGVNVAGTTVTIMFMQDAHLWLSTTTDGITYTNDGKGSADPFLVDNDTSAGAEFASITNYTDSKCNNLHQSILFFGKNDLSMTNPNRAGATGQTGGTFQGGFFAFRLRVRTFD